MKDPIETLERPAEEMSVFRNDGSSVKIRFENGKVTVQDSRNKNSSVIMEADHFLDLITR